MNDATDCKKEHVITSYTFLKWLIGELQLEPPLLSHCEDVLEKYRRSVATLLSEKEEKERS